MGIGQPKRNKNTKARKMTDGLQLEVLEPRILLSTVAPWEPELFPVPGEGQAEVPVRPGRVVAGFDPSVIGSAEELAELVAGAELVHGYSILDAGVIALPDGVSVADGIAAISQLPGVTYAEPDYIYTCDQLIPNDPDFGLLWGLHNTGQTGGTVDADIDAPEAWLVTTGGLAYVDIVVGVIDTGIDYAHPDLVDNMWTNPGEIPNNGIDDDRNGYIDDYYGWDFYDDDNAPYDTYGHGTHVAGTIGAVGDNGVGVVGVNWDVQLAALRVGPGPGLSMAAAVEAIEYSVTMGFDVTNNSWGGPGSQTLYDAIALADAQDQLFVAAAGNGGWDGIGDDNDVFPVYPTSYDLDNIIAVAATDHDDQLASFSNYGAASVDLAAPGVAIYSTMPGNSYGSMSGTSMAAPHVTGAVALLRAYNPVASAADIKTAIMDGVDVLPGLSGLMVTGGRLNLVGALGALPPPIAGIDLRPEGVVLSTHYFYGAFQVAGIDYVLRNLGDTGFGSDFAVDFYLSDDQVLDTGDDHLIGSDTVTGGLGPFERYSDSITVSDFPAADPFGSGAPYYLLFSVDTPDLVYPDGVITEVDEANNVLASSITWDTGLVFEDDFSTDRGWTGYRTDRWQRGPAEASGGAYGNPDPAFDTTATGDEYLLGYNIGGDYQVSLGATIWITSPVIDCGDFSGVTLSFQQWLNVGMPDWPSLDDHAYVEVYDGADWQTIFGNTGEIVDSEWNLMEYDVSNYADGNEDFRIRFGMGPTDAWRRYSGWNIDDVQLVGTLIVDSTAPEVEDVVPPSRAEIPTDSIEVYFTEAMALYPLSDAANYALVDDILTSVPILAAQADSDSVTLQLGSNLEFGKDYTLTVESGGLMDTAGNALAGGGLGGDFVYTFTLPGVYAGVIEVYGGRITFYDTDDFSPVDVRPDAAVRGNNRVGITSVSLGLQHSPFGVVIEQKPGSNQAIAIYDKTFSPYGIQYIVADANVSKMVIASELLGMNLNGSALTADLVLDLDIDGDGEEDDPVSIVVLGDVGTILPGAVINGDVVVNGDLRNVKLRHSLSGDLVVRGGSDLKRLTVVGGDFDGNLVVQGALGRLYLGPGSDLNGTVTAGDIGTLTFKGPAGVTDSVHSDGDIDLLWSLEPVAGDVSAGGRVGRLIARQGIEPGFVLTAGSLNLLYSRGDMEADVQVTGDVGVIKVVGGDLGGDVTVSGNVRAIRVVGGAVTQDIEVGGTLRRLDVRNRGLVALQGEVNVNGDLYSVFLDGDMVGDVWAGGRAGRIVCRGDITSDMSFGQGLASLYAAGDFSADVEVLNGNLGKVVVKGRMTDSDFHVAHGAFGTLSVRSHMLRSSITVDEGLLRRVYVGRNYEDSDIIARTLGRVKIGGVISSTGGDYEIRAAEETFGLKVGGAYYKIGPSTDQWFDSNKVHAWVGEP